MYLFNITEIFQHIVGVLYAVRDGANVGDISGLHAIIFYYTTLPLLVASRNNSFIL